jgi:preprotein translocase subunit YajC
MFATPAYAADAGQAATGAASGPTGFLMSIFPFLLIFVIFYFLLIRPQQKRMKAHQAMLGAVARNDVVVTSGGLIGKVTKVDETEVEVELAPNVRVKVVKGMLAEVRQTGVKPAND